MSLSFFDRARIDGYTGTAADFVLATYEHKGLSAARELGFNGYESELIALIKKREELDKSVADKLALRGDSAYQLAVQKGFEGDEIAWLNSLKGSDGLSAYEIALTKGFDGDLSTWVASLQGSDGSNAYELALQNGFDGTEKQWLESLKALDGLSAYELAQSLGFTGTLEEFIASLRGPQGERGPAGRDAKDGARGDKGDKGDMPAHQWDGTRLRFERPDGTWGEWVELKGAMVAAAGGGGGSLSIQKFYDGTANFPVVGKTQVLYFDTSSAPYSVYIWDGLAYQQVGGGGGGGLEETFETISKNLRSSDAVFNYNGSGDLTSIVYANGITKTLGYNSGGDLITVTLSGSTPNGIDLVKTLGYTSGGDLSSLTYSLT